MSHFAFIDSVPWFLNQIQERAKYKQRPKAQLCHGILAENDLFKALCAQLQGNGLANFALVVFITTVLNKIAGGTFDPQRPIPVDGFDAWKTISRGDPSPRTEILLNIDNVDPNATLPGIYQGMGLRMGSMKLLMNVPNTTWFKPPELGGAFPEELLSHGLIAEERDEDVLKALMDNYLVSHVYWKQYLHEELLIPKIQVIEKEPIFFTREIECVKVLAPGKWLRLESQPLCCGFIFTGALLANPTRPTTWWHKQTTTLNFFGFEHDSHFVDKDLLQAMTDL